jgi:hypothetical protein
MDHDNSFLQQVPQGDKMSNTENQKDSSLLWDCFTNWSSTLEKTNLQKDTAKNPN